MLRQTDVKIFISGMPLITKYYSLQTFYGGGQSCKQNECDAFGSGDTHGITNFTSTALSTASCEIIRLQTCLASFRVHLYTSLLM